MPLFCSYHILTSSVIYYWTDARQHGIYLLTRQRCTRHARVNLSRNVIANQERPFWEINQSYCEKVIDNACSFFVSWFWSRSEIKTFFGVEYCGKKKNRKWFSVVCTLIDHDIRHHRSQNLLGTHSAAPRESTTFWPLWWRISLSIRVQTTLNHFPFVNATSLIQSSFLSLLHVVDPLGSTFVSLAHAPLLTASRILFVSVFYGMLFLWKSVPRSGHLFLYLD